jgi:hypothetical protein
MSLDYEQLTLNRFPGAFERFDGVYLPQKNGRVICMGPDWKTASAFLTRPCVEDLPPSGLKMTEAEKRIIQFLHKTSFNPFQLVALVAIPGRISEADVREGVAHLLHEQVVHLSPDRILSLTPIEEDR